MRYIILLIVFGLLICSCKKNGHSYSITGVVYNNCEENIPIKNKDIQLFKTKDAHGNTGEVVWRGRTDSLGQFSINYEGHTSDDYLKLQTTNYSDYMTEIPANENLENVVIFVSIKANIQVSLNVINPHSIGDTLNLKDLSNPSAYLKIPCPLQSGPVYTASEFIPVNPTGFTGTRESIVHFWSPPGGSTSFTYFMIDKYCTDTVRVTIDID